MILTVGRFSYNGGHGKGYDILLKAIQLCPRDYTIYIVGDNPTQEFLNMRNEMGLNQQVQFIGFKKKEELKEYYVAADLFCLQTRGDVWGLVINEAMATGLPVITTDKCGAGLELVQNGREGFIVAAENYHKVAAAIQKIIDNDDMRRMMATNSLLKINNYTIKKMAKAHYSALCLCQEGN